MVKENSLELSTSNSKQLLRLLAFARNRTTRLRADHDVVWLEDVADMQARCRISSSAIQLGLSDGLLMVGKDGLLILLEPSKQFETRQSLGSEDDRFAQQHQEREELHIRHSGVSQRVIRNRKSAPIASLERLKSTNGKAYFSDELLVAAEMLARDFENAQLTPRVTSRWEPRIEASGARTRNNAQDMSDKAANARLRFNKALTAIGPELSGAIVDAICFEKGLELIERERGWPVRSGKLMLRTGLEILARHYQPQSSQVLPMRHWHEISP